VDNRTCSLRLVGHGQSLRVENRVPGGDVNPYLAISGMIAGALYGIENQLEIEPAHAGDAYQDATAQRVPGTLREALALWESGTVAKRAFGGEVVAHYANAARVELAAFEAAVTDWELVRGFERL
jgi:glutamine synthetase